MCDLFAWCSTVTNEDKRKKNIKVMQHNLNLKEIKIKLNVLNKLITTLKLLDNSLCIV